MTKTHKACKECGFTLPIDNFYLNTKPESPKGRSWSPRCKPCHNQKARKKLHDNPRLAKHYKLRGAYKMDIEEYETKFNNQDGKCAICKSLEPKGNGKWLYVDHNHTTLEIRGLLCHHCNFLLGHAQEDIEILKSAIKYLRKWGKP